MKISLPSLIKNSLAISDLNKIRDGFNEYLTELKGHKVSTIKFSLNNKTISLGKNFLISEIEQILKTLTIERTHYYIKRLYKSITEEKKSKINDINLNRWKEYPDLLTDSLWIFNKRDQSGAHHAGYWGNFIPQIPNQLLIRYTKKGDWVLDPFLGSGTTLIEAQRLERNAVGIELSKDVIAQTKKTLSREPGNQNVKLELVNGDSSKIDLSKITSSLKIKSFQFILLHPPYWDIIKFSKDKNDLSNAKTINEFLSGFGKVLNNCIPFLERKRFAAIVISDKYSNGEWIPLGFYLMQLAMEHGLLLKSTIVKNFEETTAKRSQKELWRYRALAGGFYVFKHEYIFIFQKK